MDITALQHSLGVPVDGISGAVTWQAAADRLCPSGHAPASAGSAIWRHFDLSSRLRTIYALATVATECAFIPREENLNYSATRLMAVWPARFPSIAQANIYANNPRGLAGKIYNGRMGNIQPSDGYMYRGRGWPQLTGRANYQDVQNHTAWPFVDNPDALLTVEGSAVGFRGFWDIKEFGPLADADSPLHFRQAYNGGLNGVAAFGQSVEQLKQWWPV